MNRKDGSRKASFSQIYTGTNYFLIDLVCPDNSSISLTHPIRDTVSNVLVKACKQLNITRTDIFGLARHECNEYKFFSPKKHLYKFLPSEAIVRNDEKLKEKAIERIEFLNNNMKTCRLYLRIKVFIYNLDVLMGRNLYYYYEQARLDSLRCQNWLQVEGFTELFYDIAAKAIWLKYGSSWTEVFQNKSLPLHFYLPMCEQNETTMETLKSKLDLIEVTSGCKNFIEKTPLSKSDSTNSQISWKSTLTENDVFIIDNRDDLMLDTVRELSRLPNYGVHYYHVSMKMNDGDKQTNCKLGIGPAGILVAVSPYYTAWKESLNINWSNVLRLEYEKNVLEVFSKNQSEPRAFLCLDEKEAKYLFKQLKEYHWYSLMSNNERRTSKRNSIGVLSKRIDENRLSVTPGMRRSSLSTFFFPRKFSK